MEPRRLPSDVVNGDNTGKCARTLFGGGGESHPFLLLYLLAIHMRRLPQQSRNSSGTLLFTKIFFLFSSGKFGMLVLLLFGFILSLLSSTFTSSRLQTTASPHRFSGFVQCDVRVPHRGIGGVDRSLVISAGGMKR
jgi:hypothetical protein